MKVFLRKVLISVNWSLTPQEVKNKRKFQTSSCKSGRSRLREVVATGGSTVQAQWVSRKFAKAQSNGSSPFKISPNNNNRTLQKHVQRKIEIPTNGK